MDIKNFFKSSPEPLERFFRHVYSIIPSKIRYGDVFWDTYNLIKRSQYWDKTKIKKYQEEKLQELLNYAYNYVPYYKKVFEKRNLEPKNIRHIGDLKNLPYLTKDLIRKNTEDLVTTEIDKKYLKYITTGGSTGKPMGFYVDKRVHSEKEWAFMFSQWERVGYRFGSKSIVLRGDIVKPSKKNIYWKYDPLNKNLILSAYHLNDENMPLYIKKIRDFKPEFIWNYPSAASILAKFMKENNVEPFKTVKAMLCGSENLYPWQRKLFEEVFKCRVYSWYGHTEQAALAGECEESSKYHIFPQYGIMELIDEKGNIINEAGKMGEIVATGFINFAFPFIRYRTEDLAMYSSEKCGCGRNYHLLETVEGRLQDIVVTKDNRYVTLTALIFGQHFNSFSRFKEMQIVQQEKGKIEIRIVSSANFTREDEEEIISRIKNAVGKGLDLKINYVKEIPRTIRGKHKFLIQELPVKYGGNSISGIN